ncbi:MAG TPA: TetR/AcrR family transcriptional regulator [Clostridia bacterium]|nr:TetR/AcrR family transcriptional regulator [Clostridia bacterium]
MNAKKSIKVAFWDLLQELPLDQITVIMLCERANVNRQSFYYYYQNIVDLLKDVLFAEIYDEVSQGRAYDTWKYGFYTTTRFINENHFIFQNIQHSNYWEEINNFFTENSNSLVKGVIDECIEATGIRVSKEDKDFMIHYYRVLFNSIMTEWVKDGMKLKPIELLSKVEKLVDGTICPALQRFSEEEN